MSRENRVSKTWESFQDPLVAVTTAIAAIEGVDPLDLPPMNDAVDIEAVQSLFRPIRATSDPTLTFRYAGFLVTLSNVEMQLEPIEPQSRGSETE